MSPQHPRKPKLQSFKAPYGDMIRWQRERLLTGNLLEEIAQEQGFQAEITGQDASVHRNEAEDRRLARFQSLCGLAPEQQRKAHFEQKQERDRLIRDIRTLHQLLSQAL